MLASCVHVILQIVDNFALRSHPAYIYSIWLMHLFDFYILQIGFQWFTITQNTAKNYAFAICKHAYSRFRMLYILLFSVSYQRFLHFVNLMFNIYKYKRTKVVWKYKCLNLLNMYFRCAQEADFCKNPVLPHRRQESGIYAILSEWKNTLSC